VLVATGVLLVAVLMAAVVVTVWHRWQAQAAASGKSRQLTNSHGGVAYVDAPTWGPSSSSSTSSASMSATAGLLADNTT
jgi:hypothetical protein